MGQRARGKERSGWVVSGDGGNGGGGRSGGDGMGEVSEGEGERTSEFFLFAGPWTVVVATATGKCQSAEVNNKTAEVTWSAERNV